MRVAVLGATGHVGRALTAGLAAGGHEVAAHARSLERLDSFLTTLPADHGVRAVEIDRFGDEPVDLVVNATGIGDPSGFGPQARALIDVTEHFDGVVLGYLERHPACRAISMSSGAAYLSDFEAPAGPATVPAGRAGERPDYAYGVVKAASEARHREAGDHAIVDLRLFGFFTRFVDPEAGFLLAQALRCIRSGEVLLTDAVDVTRDFAHADDLTALVAAVTGAPPDNRVYDVYSAGPARKFELLDMLSAHFGLRYAVSEAADVTSATGRKPCYFSTDRAAAGIGYAPRFTSMRCVEDVTASLFGGRSDATA